MSNESILIVEDEGIAAMNLRKKIELLGYQSAGIAYTGEEAVDKARESHPSLILMDIKLATEMDGIQAGKKIQEELDIPVIYLTAFSDDATVERAKETAPFAYLTKPIQDNTIKTTIEIALHKSRLEKRLKDSEQDFRALFERCPAGIALIDQAGMIIRANTAIATLLGYGDSTELLGRPIGSFFAPDDQSRLQDPQRGPSPGKGALSGEFRALKNNKEAVWTRLDVSVVHEAHSGAPVGMYLFTDISLQKEIERALQGRSDELSKSNEKLGEFVSVASHDLKAPARRVALFVRMIAKECSGQLNQRSQEYMTLVESEAKKMVQIVDDLLEYSRICHVPSELTPISLLKVVGDTLEILKPEVEESRAKITYDFLPKVLGNEGQLRRLFSNLIENAIKYNRERPRVHISAKTEGDQNVISVSDNGIGIPESEQGKVFDIFYRGHPESEFPGTGIGLASCCRIVENHLGKIWVRSTKDKGSTFFVAFPICAEGGLA